ncbi:MAG: orotate phosphoribosyltransferase [Lachnospiraceae bacterium]|jgi:orotate phosphoribosyltransferase
MDEKYKKIVTAGTAAPLKVIKGHFATNHSHINYYLDLTTLKTRASEARSIAASLAKMYLYGTTIDTILCIEGMEVIGAYLAEELVQAHVLNTNAHKTIYVITPEYNDNSQIIVRGNIRPMIRGKHVLILAGTVTTGKSANRAMEAIGYYDGILAGIAAIFTAIDKVGDVPVLSVYSKKDLPDYGDWDYHSCPLCRAGVKVDGLVNGFGFSFL